MITRVCCVPFHLKSTPRRIVRGILRHSAHDDRIGPQQLGKSAGFLGTVEVYPVLKHRPFDNPHGNNFKSRYLLKFVVIGDGNLTAIEGGVRRKVEERCNRNLMDLGIRIVDGGSPNRPMEHRTTGKQQDHPPREHE